MSAESLAQNVRQRRHELRMTQETVQDNGGPSVATLRTVETGRTPSLRNSTGKRLDKALGWPDGTALKLLHGEILAPTNVANPDVVPKAVQYRSDPVLVRAADAAPRALGDYIGRAVALVLLNHEYDEHPDPDIHELAHCVLVLASIGKGGVS